MMKIHLYDIAGRFVHEAEIDAPVASTPRQAGAIQWRDRFFVWSGYSAQREVASFNEVAVHVIAPDSHM